MPSRRLVADIAIRAPSGSLIAAVETKYRMGLTPDIATQLRRTIVVQSDLGLAPYFLLVSQAQGSAWRQHAGSAPSASPDAAFSMSSVVAHYAGEQTASTRLRGFQLELLIYRWLLDVADGVIAADDQAGQALRDLGFIDAVREPSLNWSLCLRVYVESNYLLEIALEREQADAALFILELAEDRLITLSIPSFALSEPFSTLTYRRIIPTAPESAIIAGGSDAEQCEGGRATVAGDVGGSGQRGRAAAGVPARG